MSGTRRAAATSAVAAVGLGSAVAAGAANGRGVSALVRMTATEPMSAVVPHGFAFSPSHYDGVYYYAIALDPLARGREHELIDLAAYRYGHPGYGWLAWAASGGGQPEAVPYALLAVSLLALGAAAAAASVLAGRLGLSPWLGLSVAVNPGALLAVSLDTSETVVLACVLLALVAWADGHRLGAGVAIAVGCFTKEPLLLVPLALLVFEGYRTLGERRLPAAARQRLAAVVAGPALYGVWILYCRHVFGVLPSSESSQLTAPFAGWVDTFRRAAGLVGTSEAQVGLATPALLVAVGGVLLVGLVRAIGRWRAVDVVFVAMAALVFCTNWLVLLYPKDLARLIALPLALLPFVLGGRYGRPASAPPGT